MVSQMNKLLLALSLLLAPMLAHALASGWSFVPRDPAVDPEIDVNTYTFSKDLDSDHPKYLTLKIVNGEYAEKNVKKEFQHLAEANHCTLKDELSFKKEIAKAKCNNKERDAEYTFYIKGNHDQLLLVGTYNVSYQEVDEFIQGLQNEYENPEIKE